MGANHGVKHNHGHMLWVGVLGIAAGALLMIYVPSIKAISSAVFLFAAFHLIGGIVLLSSVYFVGGYKVVSRRRSRHSSVAEKFDFGWAPGWTYGPFIGALVFVASAIAIQAAAPAYWPAALCLTVVATFFFAGGLVTRTSGSYEYAVLPMVNLLADEDQKSVVLDAGCGAGRTTIALGRALKKARIVSLDRFDSDYIEGGGQRLLERNLEFAAMSNRTHIQTGNLTALPFPPNTFDATVSAHAIDHLGKDEEQGLREMLRVLKPGGRFLLIVWVPGWTMFAVANVLSFRLKTKQNWREMASRAGFTIVDEGMFNGSWFAVLQKPEAA